MMDWDRVDWPLAGRNHSEPDQAMAATGTKTDAPAAVPLVGKKYMNKLGGMVNDAASAGVSAFARRQMEKMGWKDGKGLGKEEQGIVSHVKVKKREEFMGVR